MTSDQTPAEPAPRPPQGAVGPTVPSSLLWPLVGAGAAGAVVAMVVFAIAGLVAGNDPGVNALDARLGTIEKQVRELAARPAPATVDPKTLDDLGARLAKLEAAVAAPRLPVTDPALANRIATVENDTKVLGERIGVVARRTDEIAVISGEARTRVDALTSALAELKQIVTRQAATAVNRGEFDAAANRLAAIERSATEIAAELARQGAQEVRDRAARSALTAAALKSVIERGDPFAAELGAAKSFALDPRTLASLEPFARDGVPSMAVLGRELSMLVPALTQAAGSPPRDAGYLERLQANAEKIVRVRPIDNVPGDDALARIARIELRAAQLDVNGALAELAKLPPQLRAPAQAWIARAEAQIAAIELSRRFATEAVAALGKPVQSRNAPQ
jgi:hypothetical protein